MAVFVLSDRPLSDAGTGALQERKLEAHIGIGVAGYDGFRPAPTVPETVDLCAGALLSEAVEELVSLPGAEGIHLDPLADLFMGPPLVKHVSGDANEGVLLSTDADTEEGSLLSAASVECQS